MSDTIALCIIRVGSTRFGVSTTDIHEVLDRSYPQPVPLTPQYVTGVIPYRGNILPVLSLHMLLAIAPATSPAGVLVFATSEQHEFYGIGVDAVEGMTSVQSDRWIQNPATLDPISTCLFRGSFHDDSGLIVWLSPLELAPARLMHNEWLHQSVTKTETECTP